jgi:hypothetical protein
MALSGQAKTDYQRHVHAAQTQRLGEGGQTRDVQFLWRSRHRRSPARWRPNRRNLRGVHYLGRRQDRRGSAER